MNGEKAENLSILPQNRGFLQINGAFLQKTRKNTKKFGNLKFFSAFFIKHIAICVII